MSFILFCTLLQLLATQNFVVSFGFGDATTTPPSLGSLNEDVGGANPSPRPSRTVEPNHTRTSNSPAASNVVTKALNREQTRFFIIVGTILAVFLFLYFFYIVCASADELSSAIPYVDAESSQTHSNDNITNSHLNSADYIVRSASGTVLRSPFPPCYSSDEKSDASKLAPPSYDSSQHASSGFFAAVRFVVKRVAKKLKRSSSRQSPQQQRNEHEQQAGRPAPVAVVFLAGPTFPPPAYNFSPPAYGTSVTPA